MLISLPNRTETSIHYLTTTKVTFSSYFYFATIYPQMHGLIQQPFYCICWLIRKVAVSTGGMACLYPMMLSNSSEKTQRLGMTWWLGLELSGGSTYLVPGLPTRALSEMRSVPTMWLPHSMVASGLSGCFHGGPGLQISVLRWIRQSCLTIYNPAQESHSTPSPISNDQSSQVPPHSVGGVVKEFAANFINCHTLFSSQIYSSLNIVACI